VNAANSARGETGTCVIRFGTTSACYASTVAPHARFSFQRTSTRPSRRTGRIGQHRPSVKPSCQSVAALGALTSCARKCVYRRVPGQCQPPCGQGSSTRLFGS